MSAHPEKQRLLGQRLPYHTNKGKLAEWLHGPHKRKKEFAHADSFSYIDRTGDVMKLLMNRI